MESEEQGSYQETASIHGRFAELEGGSQCYCFRITDSTTRLIAKEGWV